MEAEALYFSVYGASSEVLFPFPGESVLAASCVAWAGCRAGGQPGRGFGSRRAIP